MTARPDYRYPAPTLADRARWLLKATPADHMLALSVASASLPVVGKHLEPFGAMAAMLQIGIAPSLIQILFTGIVFSLALAFGLGGREKASELLDFIWTPTKKSTRKKD